MDKNKLKTALLVFCAAMLAVNLLQNRQLEEDIKSLRDRYSGLESHVISELSSIRSDISENDSELKELMEQGQSFFSKTAVDVRLEGSKMAVTVSAVPKELRAGEILTARIAAGGQVYEQQLDEHNQTVFEIDVTDSVEPSLVLTSEAGVRQEGLDVLYTEQFLTFEVQGNWSADAVEAGGGTDGRNLFYAWISPGSDRDRLPFEEEDIAEAQFIIEDTGIVAEPPADGKSGSASGGGSGHVHATQVLGTGKRDVTIPRGESVPARKLAEGTGSGGTIGYTADLSEYADKKDGKYYEIYFMLTTKDGMQYVTPDNGIGSFCLYEDWEDRGSAGGSMWPVFGAD